MIIDAISQNAQLISEVLTASQIRFFFANLRTYHLFAGLSNQEINAVCSQMVRQKITISFRLHANNIIYRDIKSQNSVVNHEGKVHLIDLRTVKLLCSQDMFKNFTIIEIPHYIAPEVFQGKGYSFEADYWSLDVILYEFVCGKPPFGQNHQGDPYALFSLIKKAKLEFPQQKADENIKKLISYLLIKDAKIRSEQITFDKIKRKWYFKELRSDDLLQDRIIHPFIPRDFRAKIEESSKTSGISFFPAVQQQRDLFCLRMGRKYWIYLQLIHYDRQQQFSILSHLI